MTYPDPRYHGDGGEVSATHRDAGAAPDFVYPSGTKVHYLATGASTNGQFGLYRWEMAPGPGGPASHFHRSMSESFYVLSGTVRATRRVSKRCVCASGQGTRLAGTPASVLP